MPPKRSTSGGPKASAKARSGSRGAAKAAPARSAASAAAAAPAEDARAKEAREMFENKADGEGAAAVIKLAQFADIIRAMNTRKCMLWGDEPFEIIRREWAKIGGNVKKEINLAEFQAWWPEFVEGVEKEVAEKEAEEEAKKSALAKARAEKYGHDGVWKIDMKELNDAIEEAKKKGKTPLILDNTPNCVVETFFKYSGAYIIECKKMIMEKAQGKPVEEILSEERDRFFTGGKCFKHGRQVVFRMANTACDILSRFSNETFPAASLMDRSEVVKCLGLENAGNVQSSPFFGMAPTVDDQRDFSFTGIHEDFNVIVISQFAEDSYEEFLKPMLPLHLLQPIKPSVAG